MHANETNNTNVELSKSEQERISRLQDARKRGVKKIIIWIMVLAVIAAVIYGLVLWSKKAAENRPGEAIPELGQEHIPAGSPRPEYNSNPPTSGPHYAAPANWGSYDQPLPDEQLVHNLEHGGIWISYRDNDENLINQLKSIVDDYALKVILTSRPENDSKIAVAAWGRLMKMEEFDEDQIRDFIGSFINRGPEQVPY